MRVVSNTDHRPWISIYSPVRSFFLSSKVNSQVHCSKFCQMGGFPSPLSSRDVPERGCSSEAVHFLVVTAYCAEPSVNQALLFSSSVSWTPHEDISASWEKAGSAAREGTMNIWTTSSCNLLEPLGTDWAWSHIDHFHLMMECCCAFPTLWLGWLDNIQFIMGSSGHM